MRPYQSNASKQRSSGRERRKVRRYSPSPVDAKRSRNETSNQDVKMVPRSSSSDSVDGMKQKQNDSVKEVNGCFNLGEINVPGTSQSSQCSGRVRRKVRRYSPTSPTGSDNSDEDNGLLAGSKHTSRGQNLKKRTSSLPSETKVNKHSPTLPANHTESLLGVRVSGRVRRTLHRYSPSFEEVTDLNIKQEDFSELESCDHYYIPRKLSLKKGGISVKKKETDELVVDVKCERESSSEDDFKDKDSDCERGYSYTSEQELERARSRRVRRIADRYSPSLQDELDRSRLAKKSRTANKQHKQLESKPTHEYSVSQNRDVHMDFVTRDSYSSSNKFKEVKKASAVFKRAPQIPSALLTLVQKNHKKKRSRSPYRTILPFKESLKEEVTEEQNCDNFIQEKMENIAKKMQVIPIVGMLQIVSNNESVSKRERKAPRRYSPSPIEKPEAEAGNSVLIKYEFSENASQSPTNESIHDHVCRHCGMAYKQKQFLVRHLLVHRGDEMENNPETSQLPPSRKTYYNCNECLLTIRNRNAFIIHFRQHSGIRPFKCPKCPKAFTSAFYLKIHSVVHSNLRPFKCQQCVATFKRPHHLTNHLKYHSDVFEFVCGLCGKEFKFKQRLDKHMLSHVHVD